MWETPERRIKCLEFTIHARIHPGARLFLWPGVSYPMAMAAEVPDSHLLTL
jgi:hypothetical protein